MSKIRQLLLVEYANAYVLGFKKKYSEPKIYDAGGDLSKRWYVYYSFRNPQTEKLERQTPMPIKLQKSSPKFETALMLLILKKNVSRLSNRQRLATFREPDGSMLQTPSARSE